MMTTMNRKDRHGSEESEDKEEWNLKKKDKGV